MKCKACNGTGYVTACVYESDEIGFVDKNYECAVCNGTGQIEQTNEEWFSSLSTKEKAEVLNDLYWEFNYKARLYYNFEPTEKSFEKWLREVHEKE